MIMQGTPDIDQAKAEVFVGKVLGDASGLTAATLLAAISDRLGLFKDLATNGPATHRPGNSLILC